MAHIINDKCTGCGKCIKECPTNCILSGKIYTIDNAYCIECSKCLLVCPVNAVVFLQNEKKNLTDFE